MKITISISDALFNAAEKLANRFGVSRSELYQRAMCLFIEQHRAESITESLDTLYNSDGMSSELDPVIKHLQGLSISIADW